MITINHYFLGDFVDPFAGLADGEEEDQININPEDEDAYKKLIVSVLRPHFLSLPKIIQEKCKITLSYYLTTNQIDFNADIFSLFMLPFSPPTNPKDFFVWLWEELFPNEDYILQDPDKYKEVDDINERRRLYLRAEKNEKLEAEAAARLNKDVDDTTN